MLGRVRDAVGMGDIAGIDPAIGAVLVDHIGQQIVIDLKPDEDPAGLDVFDYFSADDSSFAALKKQTTEALQLLQGIKPEQIDGSENRMIEVKLRTKSLVFTREGFLLQFTIPQLYFHAATAYGILRSAGLELGKPDFLGEMPN